MVTNRVDATLSHEDQQAILESIRDIRDRLPFLTQLTTGEREALPRMGEKSHAFVDTAVALAKEHPDLLPEGFEPEDVERDIQLYDELQPLIFAVMQLQELLLDTTIALSGDIYGAALKIHQRAKDAGKAEPLDEILHEMEERLEAEVAGELEE